MATKEHVHHLMTQIGQQMDLGEVTEFDEENLWILGIEEDFLIEANLDEPDGRLYLAVSVGKPASGREAEIYKLLLQYNYLWEQTGGARMAMDSTEDEVHLVLDLALATLELPELQACLENLIEVVPTWRTLITQGPETSEASSLLSDLGMPGGAIRV